MEGGETGKELTAKQLGAGLFALFALLCNIVPSFARVVAPTGEVGDQGEAFIAIYFRTLPLSIALTLIVFIWLKEELDSDRDRLVASAVILVVSGFIGLGLGTNQVDQEVFSRIHGPGWVVLFEAAAYVIFSYAIYYGWALFVCAIGASLFAGYWLHEKIS